MFNQSLFDYLKLAMIEIFISHTLVNIKNQGFVEILIFFFSFSESWCHCTHCILCVWIHLKWICIFLIRQINCYMKWFRNLPVCWSQTFISSDSRTWAQILCLVGSTTSMLSCLLLYSNLKHPHPTCQGILVFYKALFQRSSLWFGRFQIPPKLFKTSTFSV